LAENVQAGETQGWSVVVNDPRNMKKNTGILTPEEMAEKQRTLVPFD
jgi:hypothetical protein